MIKLAWQHTRHDHALQREESAKAGGEGPVELVVTDVNRAASDQHAMHRDREPEAIP